MSTAKDVIKNNDELFLIEKDVLMDILYKACDYKITHELSQGDDLIPSAREKLIHKYMDEFLANYETITLDIPTMEGDEDA